MAPRKVRIDINDHVMSLVNSNGSILAVSNDNLHLCRAIITGKAHAQSGDSKKAKNAYNTIRRGDGNRNTKQRSEAETLSVAAGLQNHTGPWTLAEVQKCQDAIGDTYQIRVFSSKAFLRVIYPEQPNLADYYINLLLHNDQYYVVTSASALLRSDYYCNICLRGFNNKHAHIQCGNTCKLCHAKPACKKEEWYHCKDCNRYFLNAKCFENHKSTTVTMKNNVKKQKIIPICEKLKKCTSCKATTHVNKPHVCYHYECQLCKELVKSIYAPDFESSESHKCHMKSVTQKAKHQSFIFWDFEAIQIPTNRRDLRHKAVLCVCEKVCDLCWDKDEPCEQCGERNHVFDGDQTVDLFCKWLFSNNNKNSVAFAHNMKGYDGIFIQDWLERNAHCPSIIRQGRKIMKIKHQGVTILDSLNFIPMALKEIPKAFGYPGEKGWFCHKFGSEDRLNYKGPYPEPKYYDVRRMSKDEQDRFMEWYDTVCNDEFDYKQEMLQYCKQDVNILRTGVMKFRQLIVSQFNYDPFISCATIASTCMGVFRSNFMPPNNPIGVVPYGGYRKNDRHSLIAVVWLQYIAITENINITHALNGGEVRIGKYKVDGQNRDNPREIFEFYGCAWHGCRRCFPIRHRRVPGSDQTVEQARKNTLNRQCQLEGMGYTIRQIWECEYRVMMKGNAQIEQLHNNVKNKGPMDPRDALYGGRTSAMRMLCTPADGERIKYIDIVSLYPWSCKNSRFPTHHPTIYTENFKDLNDSDQRTYFGLVKARVYTPRGLLHPVLPFRSGSKLMFALCRKCADDRNQHSECEHNDDERSITGVWATPELYKALEKGYKVVDIYEVYHYPTSEQYVAGEPDTGLFTRYINSFLKIKQQSSGWPINVKSPDQQQAYINEYLEREGICLETDKIERNAALRSLAKLGLNSFWVGQGKFGQRSNLTRTSYCTNMQQVAEIMGDARNKVMEYHNVNEHLIRIEYVRADEFVEDSPFSNCIIAAFVTCNARLRLYEYLDALGPNALYCDTDSVFFLKTPDSYDPPTGEFLGDMKDELEGAFVAEFVAAGPKSYAYSTTDGREVIKIKGLPLNCLYNKPTVADVKMRVKQLVDSGFDQGVPYKFSGIVRDKDNALYTKEKQKVFRALNDKCRVLPDYTTLPYGY